MDREIWKTIPEFPSYQISTLGRVYNQRSDRMMAVSKNNYGHLKISLMDDRTKMRYTRSVANLVAEAFIDQPDPIADTVIILDGDHSNVRVDNLAWRPRWFAWKYTNQFNNPLPRYFVNLPVVNLEHGVVYDSIVDAATDMGLLLKDIWKSTYSGEPVYPYGDRFEVVKSL